MDVKEYLIDFQKRLIKNRKEEIGQADPLMYVIKDNKETEVCAECANETYYIDCYGEKINIDDEGDAINNLLKNCETKEEQLEIIKDMIYSGLGGSLCIIGKNIDKNSDYIRIDDIEDIENIINKTEIDLIEVSSILATDDNMKDFLNKYQIEIKSVISEDCIVPGTFFFTRDEAKEHLKRNAHHYTPEARTYALSPFRSPDYQKLLNILHNIDFENSDIKMKDTYRDIEVDR